MLFSVKQLHNMGFLFLFYVKETRYDKFEFKDFGQYGAGGFCKGVR